jgi:hypothetical protein
MIDESVIRGIYEGFYRLCEEVNVGSYTDSMSWQLHCLLTNPGIANTEKVRNAFESGNTFRLDEEYRKKFRDLTNKQNRLEAQAK